jgi:hypothetical protein
MLYPSAFFAGLEHLFSDATAQLSPLVLDLDGNGYDLSARSDTASTYFDLGTDGSAESTGWVAGGDGLLAIDSNHNGTVDNGAELFGDQTGYANGFEDLRVLVDAGEWNFIGSFIDPTLVLQSNL